MFFRPAFTLIELLVVVAIIVLLLSLLAPAMDRAIYMAELTVCASSQDATVTAVIQYAMGNDRRYPHRAGAGDPNTGWQSAMIYNGNLALNALTGGSNENVYDDRIVLREFLSLNASLNCPLVGDIDFEQLDVDTHAYAVYQLWFGWQRLGQKGMKKFNDKWGYVEQRTGKSMQSSVLVSDRAVEMSNGNCQATHPDRDGVMREITLQNGLWDIGLGSGGFKLTISTYRSDARSRGLIDQNYAFADGAVRRIDEIAWRDPEMAWAYDWNNGHGAGWAALIPREP